MLTIIRKQQLRTYTTLVAVGGANPHQDADQLSGNDILLHRDGTKTVVVSDLTVQDSATKGAVLIGIDSTANFGSNKTVQSALDQLATSAGAFLGVYANVAALPAAAAGNSGKVALVWNTSTQTESGLYLSNGSIWAMNGALIDYASGIYEVYDDIDVNGNEIHGLPSTPTIGSAATSKTYVDSLIAGRKWKDPVQYKADIVVNTYANLPAVTAADNGKYAFVTGDASGDGLLYQVAAGVWPTQTSGAVAPTNGNLLMLNGGHLSITGEVSDDDILEYQSAAGGWDYDNTNSRTVTTAANDTRIYSVDDNGYTYDADTTKWVLADATGGTVGDRQYTENNWVADSETVTVSINKLDQELFDIYGAIGLAANESVANLAYGSGTVMTDATTIEAALTAANSEFANLAAVTNGQGASKIGLEDSGGNTAQTNVEGAIAEIYGKLNADDIKGWAGYAAANGVATAGGVNFDINSPSSITITPTHWAGLTVFMGGAGAVTFGTDSATNYTAMAALAAAGFDIQVEVDGTVQPIRYATWDASSSGNLVIKLDGDLKQKDFVVVKLRRNGYSA